MVPGGCFTPGVRDCGLLYSFDWMTRKPKKHDFSYIYIYILAYRCVLDHLNHFWTDIYPTSLLWHFWTDVPQRSNLLWPLIDQSPEVQGEIPEGKWSNYGWWMAGGLVYQKNIGGWPNLSHAQLPYFPLSICRGICMLGVGWTSPSHLQHWAVSIVPCSSHWV